MSSQPLVLVLSDLHVAEIGEALQLARQRLHDLAVEYGVEIL